MAFENKEVMMKLSFLDFWKRIRMKLQRNLTFLKKFFTQPKKNASVWPTSDDAAELLCSSVNWSKVKTVVELGPGTGPVTECIFDNLTSGATYFGIEYDQDFLELLHERFPTKQTFIQGNVKDLEQLIQQYAIPQPEVIISTLPNNVFQQYPHLVAFLKSFVDRGGVFRAITYAPDVFLDVYTGIDVKVLGHTWKNIPPLHVLGVN